LGSNFIGAIYSTVCLFSQIREASNLILNRHLTQRAPDRWDSYHQKVVGSVLKECLSNQLRLVLPSCG
jgi:hypothetical protein